MLHNKLSRYTLFVFITSLALLLGSFLWAWDRFGPTERVAYPMKEGEHAQVRLISQSRQECDLTIRHYKQIGREMQFELYSGRSGLAPYIVQITQGDRHYDFHNVPHRAGKWLTLSDLKLTDGPATLQVTSKRHPECETTVEFKFDLELADQILAPAQWIRHGSEDLMLDVRPMWVDGKYILKDFANYQDGRTKVYLIDNIIVQGLESGMEIQPGYLYSVTASWIDAPYREWWNHLRNRSIRQQHIWVMGKDNKDHPASRLTPVRIPSWFKPSSNFNVAFDTQFPPFSPIEGKLVMQYRLNADVPAKNYFNRGITHLPKWEEGIPPHKTHWTEPPGFFADKDEAWFSSLSRAEVEAYADRVYPSGVYAFDFEFWDRNYKPDVKQRLMWFAERVKRNNPTMHMFDYWGGPAYHNPNFWHGHGINPAPFKSDYDTPKSTYSNLAPLANGQSLSNYFSITPIDVYPKSFFSGDPEGITPSNYLILSAIHTARINRLFPSQKNNLEVWFAWNRYLPLHRDPAVPWHVTTTAPEGELQFDQLATMPASQALGMSLFSLIESDGYYLWHDNQAWGRGPNNYALDANKSTGYQWFPADGTSNVASLRRKASAPESPRYWDYPTEFFVLGNWMAKQVEDILTGGKAVDLDYQFNNTWQKATRDQAVRSAERREPFVLGIVKGSKIAVLAIDSFQKPNHQKTLPIRLPNGKIDSIRLYGNWPSLYRGEL